MGWSCTYISESKNNAHSFLSFFLCSFEVAASSCCCYFKQKNGVTGLSKKDCNTRLKQIPSMKICARHQVEPGEGGATQPARLPGEISFEEASGAAQLW